jgi:hypothetical protein
MLNIYLSFEEFYRITPPPPTHTRKIRFILNLHYLAYGKETGKMVEGGGLSPNISGIIAFYASLDFLLSIFFCLIFTFFNQISS